ncbi:MAG: amidohydrolase, partial [Gammaproteobacteria bacterium]|nr:amidohydrolase [Gammaproteobacteria bacterium]
MIIDCHGHYTTAPDALGEYRDRQKSELANDPLHRHVKGELHVTDDQIRESLEGAQLRLQRERGTDLTIFSPRASWMGHHIGNESTSLAWTEHCNDLIHRITRLYP